MNETTTYATPRERFLALADVCASGVLPESAPDAVVPGLRFATADDIDLICELRVAQSFEYWNLDAAPASTDAASAGTDAAAGTAPASAPAASAEAAAVFRAQTRSYLEAELNRSIIFALIDENGQTASMAGLQFNDRLPAIDSRTLAAEASAYVTAAYTRPAFRGHGHMKRLIRMWIELARAAGLDAVYLETHNPVMRHIVDLYGYEQTSGKFRVRVQG